VTLACGELVFTGNVACKPFIEVTLGDRSLLVFRRDLTHHVCEVDAKPPGREDLPKRGIIRRRMIFNRLPCSLRSQ